MMRISVNYDDDDTYTVNADFELSEDCDSFSAVEIYVKALQLEGYQNQSIAEALYEKALKLYPEVVNIYCDEVE